MAKKHQRRQAGKQSRDSAPTTTKRWTAPTTIAVIGAVVAVAVAVFFLTRGGPGEAPVSAASGASASTEPVPLGTTYPDREPIDPDAPRYEGGSWTQAMVTQAFARAKAAGQPAYKAYQAARTNADVLQYATCPCGCKLGASHRSAVDCFKDMHGFG